MTGINKLKNGGQKEGSESQKQGSESNFPLIQCVGWALSGAADLLRNYRSPELLLDHSAEAVGAIGSLGRKGTEVIKYRPFRSSSAVDGRGVAVARVVRAPFRPSKRCQGQFLTAGCGGEQASGTVSGA